MNLEKKGGKERTSDRREGEGRGKGVKGGKERESETREGEGERESGQRRSEELLAQWDKKGGRHEKVGKLLAR